MDISGISCWFEVSNVNDSYDRFSSVASTMISQDDTFTCALFRYLWYFNRVEYKAERFAHSLAVRRGPRLKFGEKILESAGRPPKESLDLSPQ